MSARRGSRSCAARRSSPSSASWRDSRAHARAGCTVNSYGSRELERVRANHAASRRRRSPRAARAREAPKRAASSSSTSACTRRVSGPGGPGARVERATGQTPIRLLVRKTSSAAAISSEPMSRTSQRTRRAQRARARARAARRPRRSARGRASRRAAPHDEDIAHGALDRRARRRRTAGPRAIAGSSHSLRASTFSRRLSVFAPASRGCSESTRSQRRTRTPSRASSAGYPGSGMRGHDARGAHLGGIA